MSFLNPRHSHSVHLIGSIASEVPENARWQHFDEQYLLPISKDLGLDVAKTAILIGLRNAWIAYFQESKISKVSVNEIRRLMTNEIATDYVVLTSDKWSEHPWIQEQIDQLQAEEHPSSLEEISDNPGCEMHRQAWLEEEDAWREMQREDINYCITEFSHLKRGSTSFLEVDAVSAEYDIKDAKKRIQELNMEIEGQEAIIRAAMRPIRKFRNAERSTKKRAPGRPKETREQQENRAIAKKFVSRWIQSLMDALSASSCGELVKIAGGQKMTWWRWLNKETLPSAPFLESLLNVEIKSGGRDTKIRDVQTNPSLSDLITLVDLI